jgi:hypothetical protein
MLAGAHYSASRHSLRLARNVNLPQYNEPESDI